MKTKEEQWLIIDGKILITQEEWDKLKDYKGGLELTKSLMFTKLSDIKKKNK